jgi:DMSO/TMAO reductase YedYZ molybdopterin-dependent catalytic subunit
LPPGQSTTLKWPILHYGSIPHFDAERWDFRARGLVEEPLRFTWAEFNSLPRISVTRDFHCVTRWSRFDNRWEGVALREILRRVRLRPGTAFVMVHAEQGFTANAPLTDLDREDVLLASHHDGQPLSLDHGYPLRLVVPHLYAWKVREMGARAGVPGSRSARFLGAEWYHMYGDPWKEQRHGQG